MRRVVNLIFQPSHKRAISHHASKYGTQRLAHSGATAHTFQPNQLDWVHLSTDTTAWSAIQSVATWQSSYTIQQAHAYGPDLLQAAVASGQAAAAGTAADNMAALWKLHPKSAQTQHAWHACLHPIQSAMELVECQATLRACLRILTQGIAQLNWAALPPSTQRLASQCIDRACVRVQLQPTLPLLQLLCVEMLQPLHGSAIPAIPQLASAIAQAATGIAAVDSNVTPSAAQDHVWHTLQLVHAKQHLLAKQSSQRRQTTVHPLQAHGLAMASILAYRGALGASHLSAKLCAAVLTIITPQDVAGIHAQSRWCLAVRATELYQAWQASTSTTCSPAMQAAACWAYSRLLWRVAAGSSDGSDALAGRTAAVCTALPAQSQAELCLPILWHQACLGGLQDPGAKGALALYGALSATLAGMRLKPEQYISWAQALALLYAAASADYRTANLLGVPDQVLQAATAACKSRLTRIQIATLGSALLLTHHDGVSSTEIAPGAAALIAKLQGMAHAARQPPATRTSKMQLAAKAALQALMPGEEVAVEYYDFASFQHVDVACPDRKLALSIDGAHHVAVRSEAQASAMDLQLQQLRGAKQCAALTVPAAVHAELLTANRGLDLAQTKLLQRAGWRVVRIPAAHWMGWNDAGQVSAKLQQLLGGPHVAQ